jgi:hypothetical protein
MEPTQGFLQALLLGTSPKYKCMFISMNQSTGVQNVWAMDPISHTLSHTIRTDNRGLSICPAETLQVPRLTKVL